MKQHDEKLQTIFNTIFTEFCKYSNCKTLSVQLKQCNKNRMVANNLKNALQEYLKTQSVNIEVLRFISCQDQPTISIIKCFSSRNEMLKAQLHFTTCFPHFTNGCRNFLSWKCFLYVTGPSLLEKRPQAHLFSLKLRGFFLCPILNSDRRSKTTLCSKLKATFFAGPLAECA